MKNLTLFTSALVLTSQLAFSGGDFEVVEPVITVPVVEEDPSFFYVGLAGTNTQVYSTEQAFFGTSDTQDELGQIVLQVGYNYNEYLAFEARFGTTVGYADYADVDSYSIFVRPQYPVSEDFTVYALLGFGQVNVDGTDGDTPAAPSVIGQEILSESAFHMGLGVEYKIYEDFSIFVDYTVLASDADISSTLYGYDPVVYDELSVQVLAVGVNYKF